jgi:uncharacterized protein YbbK (DUF523 family)
MMGDAMPEPILVSACLLGLSTRYDGRNKLNGLVLEYLRRENLLPVPICPEQLAGLPTPRPKSFFTSGGGSEVLDGKGLLVQENGSDVGATFIHGAGESLKIAQLAGCRRALFKDGSPSCGVHRIYLGAEQVAGQGVATALLLRHGLQVISEGDV